MKRAVRNLIWFVAAGLMVFGGMQIGLEFVKHRLNHAETNLWQYVIGALLIIFGTISFAAASQIAARLTDEDDDEPPPPPDL